MQLGGVNEAQAEQDIKDAAALGVDAFAVNLRMFLSSHINYSLTIF
jgi:hypothetical protein